MSALLLEFALWIKALHIIAVLAWMAGMFYLPRLYVYHADATAGSELSETLKLMERRLLRAIINPAMIIAWILGGLLLATPGLIEWSDGWIHVKLVAVVGLSTLHGLYARWCKDFAADRNRRSARFYRIANEVPSVLVIVIVVMVVVRPF